tara:strand:- start:19187 stop:20530 length:1344 start_codon:yes stop_codon:yes gene_type:complete
VKKKILTLLSATLCIIHAHQPITAQSTISGDVQNFSAIQTYSNNDLINARNRLKINVNHATSFGEIHAETQIYHNYNDSFDIELLLRELYSDIYTSDYDIRIGLQRLTTGRSDAGFVTNIYSGIDFRDFLTKEPDEIILGTLAINVRRYFDQNSVQLILSPTHNKSRLPGLSSRWFPIQNIEGPFEIKLLKDNQKYSLSEFSGSLSYSNRSIPNLDIDFNLLYWNYPSPSFGFRFNNIDRGQNVELDLIETYEKSIMVGLSGQVQLSPSWFITGETLFVQNRLFTFSTIPTNQLEAASNDPFTAFQVLSQFSERNDNYLMGKPWIHTMAGVQSEMFGITISGQLYLEWILDYDQRILAQPFFPYATLLLTRTFYRDRLNLSSLYRFNFAGNDWLYQLQGTYEITDGFEATIGTNLMGGNEADPYYGHFSFNQYRDNSFIFLRITYYF